MLGKRKYINKKNTIKKPIVRNTILIILQNALGFLFSQSLRETNNAHVRDTTKAIIMKFIGKIFIANTIPTSFCLYYMGIYNI